MGHADTRTFLKHYLSRRVSVDTQAIVRGSAPQEDIMRAACRMSRWVDPERPWRLTHTQSSSVNDDPTVQRLMRHLQKLRGKHSRLEEYKAFKRKLNSEKQRLKNKLLKEVREKWDSERASQDIKDQLSGKKFTRNIRTALNLSSIKTPEHKKLIETIFSLPGSTLEDETSRRVAAINAISHYCNLEESYSDARDKSTNHQWPLVQPNIVDKGGDLLEAAKLSVYQDRRPRICCLCLGNENLSIARRTYSFSSPGDLTKHVLRSHIGKASKDTKYECRLCHVVLAHKMHMQRHLYDIHGTVT